ACDRCCSTWSPCLEGKRDRPDLRRILDRFAIERASPFSAVPARVPVPHVPPRGRESPCSQRRTDRAPCLCRLRASSRAAAGKRSASSSAEPPAGRLCAVALLVLLAGAAPAGVVAAQLVVLRHLPLLRPRRRGRNSLVARSGGRDRVGAGQRLVLVTEGAVAAAVLPVQ